MVILGNLKIIMVLYVLKLGPFHEWRMGAFLTFSNAAAGDKVRSCQLQGLPRPSPNTPLTQTSKPSHYTPPCTTVKDNPAPSMAHYRVAFLFFS